MQQIKSRDFVLACYLTASKPFDRYVVHDDFMTYTSSLFHKTFGDAVVTVIADFAIPAE